MHPIKELLPIGSVVILKGGQKRVMVFGVRQTDKSTDIEYDYIGVMYPEGNMEEAGQFLFNHDDIEEVFFTGFEDPERDRFLEALEEFYQNQETDV